MKNISLYKIKNLSKTNEKNVSIFKTDMFMRQNLFVTVFIILAFVFGTNLSVYSQTKNSTKVKTVVIDPGHGGADPGAVGKISKEKDLTLTISLLLGDMIKQHYKDVNVIYTRTDDSFVELYKRAEIANKNNADLFICVHINASTSYSPYGSETFVMGIDKTGANLQVAKLENSVILKEDNYLDKYEGFDPNDPETHIIFSLYQNANLTSSLSFAQLLQNNFTNNVGRFNRGVKQAGFLVLWKTTMPSVLVELGFISNAEEEKYLNSAQGQQDLAKAIFDAFATYKTKLEEEDSQSSNSSGNSTIIVNNNTVKEDNQIEVNNSDNSILFKIQVLTSTKRMELIPENFKSYQNVDVYLQDGVYKYTIGADSDYNKIVELHKKVIKDYPDSFIVALKNGVRIPVNQARSDVKNK
jgi:N-acetylmuramoyl-L-alanine amidase